MALQDVFQRRERALEAVYFRARDARLVEMLRARADFDDLALALKEKLRVDDPELLREIKGLGLTDETAGALMLGPAVAVAWADGGVTARERRVVEAVAESRGLEEGSPARQEVEMWLERRPPEAMFDVALRAIRSGLSVLPPVERAERVRRVMGVCKRVALASDGVPAMFGGPGRITAREAEVMEGIEAVLRA